MTETAFEIDCSSAESVIKSVAGKDGDELYGYFTGHNYKGHHQLREIVELNSDAALTAILEPMSIPQAVNVLLCEDHQNRPNHRTGCALDWIGSDPGYKDVGSPKLAKAVMDLFFNKDALDALDNMIERYYQGYYDGKAHEPIAGGLFAETLDKAFPSEIRPAKEIAISAIARGFKSFLIDGALASAHVAPGL